MNCIVSSYQTNCSDATFVSISSISTLQRCCVALFPMLRSFRSFVTLHEISYSHSYFCGSSDAAFVSISIPILTLLRGFVSDAAVFLILALLRYRVQVDSELLLLLLLLTKRSVMK